MCRVPVHLRELVKQRLAAAAEEIFELLEKTIKEYEEQTERQRTLLKQLLQPGVPLSPSDRGAVTVEAAEGHSESPLIKGEQDIIRTQLCSETLSAPTWSTKTSPQTQPDVAGVSETEETSAVSVKTEEGRTWTPPPHHTPVPLPPAGGALLQHTQTVPLPPAGGALLQHTQTVPLPPAGGALPQTEEELLPQDAWRGESLDLNPPMDSPEAPQPRPVHCPGPSAAAIPLYPPHGALPPAPRNQKPQKRFHCTLCPKAFTSNFHLVSHMRVHTGERPFECPVCEKSFRVKGNLDQHMMIHYDLRPFSCTFCGKAFSQKSNLNNHLWVHTGVKPFSCSVCGKQYRQRSSLSLHMASH